MAIRYVVTGGYFHNDHDRSEHRTLSAARKAVAAHGRECGCNGVAVEARGSAADLAESYETECAGRILPLPGGDRVSAVIVGA